MESARLPSGRLGPRSSADSLMRRSGSLTQGEQQRSSVLLRPGSGGNGALAADEALTFNNQVRRLSRATASHLAC